jgi:ubiquinone/menaquinone biosynthesis C-methylase UbiE
MSFKDHFSKVASGYAAFRPSYPAELFEWLAQVPSKRALAWDCACGNGQATTHLAQYFGRVIATDASEAQVSAAPRDLLNIEWRVATAEQSGIPDRTVDLVTVAQAVHWFDLPKFYEEVDRVLVPGGVVAIWCYGINDVEGRTINEIVRHFYSSVVGPFWPPERKLIESGYATLDFPYREIKTPEFNMETTWDLEQLLGYFRTWSATTRCIAEKKEDPINALRDDLLAHWGEPERKRLIRWPLSVRAGLANRNG